MGKEAPFTNIMLNNMRKVAYNNKICMISIISKYVIKDIILHALVSSRKALCWHITST